jgi:hypothetical protein
MSNDLSQLMHALLHPAVDSYARVHWSPPVDIATALTPASKSRCTNHRPGGPRVARRAGARIRRPR